MDYTIFENVFKKIVCSAMLKGIVNYTCEKPVEKPDTQTNYVLVVTISIMILILLFSLYDSCSNIPKKKSVALLPILKAENMDIFLIENRHDCKVACSIITEYCRLSNVIGFDCEWVSRYDRGPVALVQLACQNGCCYLFRLNLIGHEAYELKELLENDKIIKVGVCPFNDAKYLRADYDWQVNSTLDLRHLYPTCTGLGKLAEKVLGISLDKNSDVRYSNWEGYLSSESLIYAAKDAYVSMKVFKKWLCDELSVLQLKEMDIYTTLMREKNIYRRLERLFDVEFDIKSLQRKLQKNSRNETDELLLPQTIQTMEKKIYNSGHATRKTPLYQNCFMYAPDGELLCSCDTRKALWYLERDLAENISPNSNSLKIKLKFQPSGRASESNEGMFYRQLKQNCCVVCGAKDSWIRHWIVPKEYRKHFPEIMKSHQSHDVVLMCIKCHLLTEKHSNIFKMKLAILCEADIDPPKVTHSREIKKIRNFAKALLTSGHLIPLNRKTYLEKALKEYFEVENLTKQLLEKAASMKADSVNKDSQSHGRKVIQYYSNINGGLMLFEKIWRKNFLKKMRPQYLPALWSVNHNHSRLLELSQKNYCKKS